MAEQKRFQAQSLNSEDYQKTELGAKAVKEGGVLLTTLIACGVGVAKLAPSLIKNVSKIFKS